jgi:anti-sigma regulatory factor (Ser/Thr protein kinase)
MIVPAEARYVRAVRLVAASLAADSGFDVEELEDVRVAVDELCALFKPSDDTATIELDFTSTDGELQVSGRYLGTRVITACRC